MRFLQSVGASSARDNFAAVRATSMVCDVRVLFSALWLGGAGGCERAVHCALKAFENDQVDLVVHTQLDGPWSVIPPSVRVNSPDHWRWIWANSSSRYKGRLAKHALNPLRRELLPKYDVDITFPHGLDLSNASRSTVRLVIPGGTIIGPRHGKFDFVAMESPDNLRFVPEGARSLLLPPPLAPLADTVDRPEVALPAEYFLTVFNPYDPVKGSDDLASVADTAPLPIVWCHSDRTLKFAIDPFLAHHPNIFHVRDATPEQMRYLYEGCAAYLAFSRSESFGFSAADALRYSRAIVSRPVGVFSFPESRQGGVHMVGETWEFDWSLLEGDPAPMPLRDVSWLSPEAFRARVGTIVAENSQPADRQRVRTRRLRR